MIRARGSPQLWSASAAVSIRIDGIAAISLIDDSFADGQAGMASFGHGHARFRDLQVEALK
jgi:hypothetical protein